MTEPSLASAIRAGSRRRPSRRVVRYVVTGGTSFAVDLAVLVVLRQWVDAPLWAATTVAYWTGFCVNFTLQRTVTFAATGAVGGQLWRYAALVAVNFVGTLLIVSASSAAHIGYATGKVLAVIVFVVMNYLAYDRWVFRGREMPDAA